jgi:hypothetical protein
MSNMFHDTLPQVSNKVGDEGTVESVGGRANRRLSLRAILSANQGESASSVDPVEGSPLLCYSSTPRAPQERRIHPSASFTMT